MSALLEEMIELWGGQFQELNNLERLWMIQNISKNMCEADNSEAGICQTVDDSLDRIDELNTRDKLNLILALINQVIN